MANVLVNKEIVKAAPKSVYLLSGSVDTAETAVTKIDISGLPGAPERIKICWVKWSTEGLNAQLAFDRASGGDACILVGGGKITDPIEDIGTGAGTGDLKLSTLDLASAGNRGYSIEICVEGIPA